jgi:putative ABC transport system permease protein
VVVPEIGAWPPAEGGILIERQALSVLGARIGQQATIKIPDDIGKAFRITGLVHDIVLPQAEMENVVYGYISLSSLARLGEESFFNELNITLSENNRDRGRLKKKAYELESWLGEQGYRVQSIKIPEMGKHPHYAITSGMFTIQRVFGYLCCLFSGVLVFNLFSAALMRERAQIGVMKALGASTSQIRLIYYGTVVCLGLMGLALGMPLAIFSGRMYAACCGVRHSYAGCDLPNLAGEPYAGPRNLA